VRWRADSVGTSTVTTEPPQMKPSNGELANGASNGQSSNGVPDTAKLTTDVDIPAEPVAKAKRRWGLFRRAK
jgi:hypothetical protein